MIGQDEACDSTARAIMRASSGLKNPERPIATLLFSGPTGVGKTELTKVGQGHKHDSLLVGVPSLLLCLSASRIAWSYHSSFHLFLSLSAPPLPLLQRLADHYFGSEGSMVRLDMR